MAATDAKPIPLKNTAYRVTAPILDADGDPVTAATALDSEVSIDGGAFSDCTNEATEIGTSGIYYLDLTAAEMNGDTIVVRIQTSSAGAKTTVLIMYPEEAGDIRVNVTQVSGDATAADNLEAQFDGTGLTGDTYPARQSDITGLASGSAAISTTAESFTQATGTQAANTYTSTVARDGTAHQLADAAGTLDAYYQFDVGADGVPTSSTFYAALTGNNDSIGVYAYNWVGSAWVQIGTISGTTGITYSERTFSLFTNMVGTGANLGKVRVRLYGTGLTTSNTYIDQIYVGYSVVRRTVGYANGAVWVDTVDGSSGTTVWTNGTADNPVGSLADAITIANGLGVTHLHFINGSSVTLAQNMINWTLMGENWELALGGQDVSGATVHGAHVSGVASGTTHAHFFNCEIDGTTLPPLKAVDCYLTGTLTLAGAGDWFFLHCGDGVAGANHAQITMAANASLHMQNYSGGIQLNSMGATNDLEIGGRGHIVFAASCTGGTANIRGSFQLTNSGSGLTITDGARWSEDQSVNIASGGFPVGGYAAGAITTASVGTGVTVGTSAQQGARSITVHVQTSGAVAIPDVSVSIYDSTGTTGIDRKVTNASGDAVFALDDADYDARLSHAGYSFTVPEEFTVSADATVTITGTAVTVADDTSAYEARPLRRQKVRYNSTNLDTPLKYQRVSNGAKATPSSATIALYDTDGTTVLLAATAMTVSGTLCTYSPATTTTADWPVATGYRARIIATIGGVDYTDDIIFDVCKFVLALDVGVDQLTALDDRISAMAHDGDEDFSELIEAVRDELHLLLEMKATEGKMMLEDMMVDKSRVSIPARYRVLAQIFQSKQNYEAAKMYQEQFDKLWKAVLAGVKLDSNQDLTESSQPKASFGTRLRF